MTDTFRKPSEEELRSKLTPVQYKVTQHEGTEAPFRKRKLLAEARRFYKQAFT